MKLDFTKDQLRIKQEGFEKRYGKKVNITGDMLINDKKELEAYRLTFKSPKNTYEVKEQLKDGLTQFVLLKYKKDGREFNRKYNRFLDCEVNLADYISEE